MHCARILPNAADTLLIFGVAVADGVLLWLTPWTIVWRNEIGVAIGILLLAGIGVVYRYLRPTPALADLAADGLRFVLFTNFAAILSYILTGLSPFPLHDAGLNRLDVALGFDWVAYNTGVAAHPGLSALLSMAYASALPQLAGLVILCAHRRDRRGARELFHGFAGAGLLVIVIGALFPAAGAAFSYHWMAATSEPVHQYLALRSGRLQVFDLAKIQGLVWFPSFHAGLACLYVWVARRTRRLIVPAFLLNSLMLAACLADGGHYLVDLIAGAGIMAVVLWASRRLEGCDVRGRPAPPRPANAAPRRAGNA